MTKFDIIGIETDDFELYKNLPYISLLLGDPLDETGLTPAKMFYCDTGGVSPESLLASIVQRTNGDVYSNCSQEDKIKILSALKPEIKARLLQELSDK